MRRAQPSASASCCCAAARCPSRSRRRPGVAGRRAPAARRRRRGRASSATTPATRSSRRGRRARERILSTFRAVRPVAVLVELFPFGRAKFARELVPLLEAARAAGALTACSLRDILVSRRATSARHDDRAARLAEAHLDAVLVHSDPRFARLEDTFAPSRPLRVPVHYTGFVVRDPARPPAAAATTCWCPPAAGWSASRCCAPPPRRSGCTGVPMRLIGGPLLPDDAWRAPRRARARPGLELRAHRRPTSAPSSRGARASVSQGGYNTALEVLRAGVPGAARPLRDAGGGRAAPPRAAARAPRRRPRAPPRAARATTLAARDRALLALPPRPASVDLDGAPHAAADGCSTALLLEEAVACAPEPRRPHAAPPRAPALARAGRRRRRHRRAHRSPTSPSRGRSRWSSTSCSPSAPPRSRSTAATCGCSSCWPARAGDRRRGGGRPVRARTCGCRRPASGSATTCACASTTTCSGCRSASTSSARRATSSRA